MALQTCNKCGQVKPLEDFKKHYNFKSGYARTCKKCHREEAKAQRGLASGVILVISDTQAPAHHPDTIPFLKAIKAKYNPTTIIGGGDEMDFYHLSNYAKEAVLDNPQKEYDEGIAFMKELYALFPKVQALESNHVHGRINQAMVRGRLIPALMQDVHKALQAPAGWSWHDKIVIGDIIFDHGDRVPANLNKVIKEELVSEYGRHYSIMICHHHSKLGEAAKMWVGAKIYWGAFGGCLIDKNHGFFKYSKKYASAKVGVCVIIDGRAHEKAMPMDKHNRWTGEIF